MALIKIKNTSGADGTWVGQTIVDTEYYEIPTNDQKEWADDSQIFADIASGNLTVNDGVNDIVDAKDGWRTLEGSIILPYSDIDEGKKLAVHPSYKPILTGGTTYAVWSGSGDDITGSPAIVGDGELLEFSLTPGTASITKEAHFAHADHGRVWIHEGYLKFEDGGPGDYMTVDVIAAATPLQQVAALDLVMSDNWVSYSPSGPGTGTHGFADATAITLVPRTYSQDGDWDFDGVNLTPNFTQTGGFKISDIDRAVHRFINKIPCLGSSPYFTMSSDETAELNTNYFLRLTAFNVSDTTWTACCMMEIYRERTVEP